MDTALCFIGLCVLSLLGKLMVLATSLECSRSQARLYKAQPGLHKLVFAFILKFNIV